MKNATKLLLATTVGLTAVHLTINNADKLKDGALKDLAFKAIMLKKTAARKIAEKNDTANILVRTYMSLNNKEHPMSHDIAVEKLLKALADTDKEVEELKESSKLVSETTDAVNKEEIKVSDFDAPL